ncbi:MAG: hypothetical protein MZV64_25055 [Ignavibacteriales bacterium]|nr:hypothetical protein [Ignavibacteriales bacterium]
MQVVVIVSVKNGLRWEQLTEPRGACAFVGPTSNTHTAYNNTIDMGIYLGMFPQSGIAQLRALDSPGEALLKGKMFMYLSVLEMIYWVPYHYQDLLCSW